MVMYYSVARGVVHALKKPLRLEGLRIENARPALAARNAVSTVAICPPGLWGLLTPLT